MMLMRILHHLQVKEVLVEESNVQPVNSPVTVRKSGRCCQAGLDVFGIVAQLARVMTTTANMWFVHFFGCRCVVTSMDSFTTC